MYLPYMAVVWYDTVGFNVPLDTLVKITFCANHPGNRSSSSFLACNSNIAPYVDIILHRGWFWAKSAALGSDIWQWLYSQNNIATYTKQQKHYVELLFQLLYTSVTTVQSGLCWTVFAQNRDTVVPAEGNGDLQTLICVLVARPRRCLTLSNPVLWQNWMAAYLGYTLRMKTLFRGWPVMVHDTHTRRRRLLYTGNGLIIVNVNNSTKLSLPLSAHFRQPRMCSQGHHQSSQQAPAVSACCSHWGSHTLSLQTAWLYNTTILLEACGRNHFSSVGYRKLLLDASDNCNICRATYESKPLKCWQLCLANMEVGRYKRV